MDANFSVREHIAKARAIMSSGLMGLLLPKEQLEAKVAEGVKSFIWVEENTAKLKVLHMMFIMDTGNTNVSFNEFGIGIFKAIIENGSGHEEFGLTDPNAIDLDALIAAEEAADNAKPAAKPQTHGRIVVSITAKAKKKKKAKKSKKAASEPNEG